ncbi:hypothetical protein BU14_0519s0019 [Porphyra umbilicalis]|uniref:Uncharacterized protein n=1 Tax=Porphyra umbilicalis TaxID=2786 RepID=A0A1X6NSQ5_PORUM|nr:hypothetical protein BU14_0519s0019 [Porphyra umbilicalis]|eukprot:OSX71605.1 hypothetical protein BU14_0519s0019 [Porphyra umbilicalis]
MSVGYCTARAGRRMSPAPRRPHPVNHRPVERHPITDAATTATARRRRRATGRRGASAEVSDEPDGGTYSASKSDDVAAVDASSDVATLLPVSEPPTVEAAPAAAPPWTPRAAPPQARGRRPTATRRLPLPPLPRGRGGRWRPSPSDSVVDAASVVSKSAPSVLDVSPALLPPSLPSLPPGRAGCWRPPPSDSVVDAAPVAAVDVSSAVSESDPSVLDVSPALIAPSLPSVTRGQAGCWRPPPSDSVVDAAPIAAVDVSSAVSESAPSVLDVSPALLPPSLPSLPPGRAGCWRPPPSDSVVDAAPVAAVDVSSAVSESDPSVLDVSPALIAPSLPSVTRGQAGRWRPPPSDSVVDAAPASVVDAAADSVDDASPAGSRCAASALDTSPELPSPSLSPLSSLSLLSPLSPLSPLPSLLSLLSSVSPSSPSPPDASASSHNPHRHAGRPCSLSRVARTSAAPQRGHARHPRAAASDRRPSAASAADRAAAHVSPPCAAARQRTHGAGHLVGGGVGVGGPVVMAAVTAVAVAPATIPPVVVGSGAGLKLKRRAARGVGTVGNGSHEGALNVEARERRRRRRRGGQEVGGHRKRQRRRATDGGARDWVGAVGHPRRHVRAEAGRAKGVVAGGATTGGHGVGGNTFQANATVGGGGWGGGTAGGRRAVTAAGDGRVGAVWGCCVAVRVDSHPPESGVDGTDSCRVVVINGSAISIWDAFLNHDGGIVMVQLRAHVSEAWSAAGRASWL